MFSFGSKSRSALTTVRPPMPESQPPIGRRSLMQHQNSLLSRRPATTSPSPFQRVRVNLQLSIPHLNPHPSPRERRTEAAEALLEFANPLWLWMILRNGRAFENLRSEDGRAEVVSTLDRQSRLRGGRNFEEEAVLDRNAAAEHHRR